MKNKEMIEILEKIKDTCNHSNCRQCPYLSEEGCIFYSKPFDWYTAFIDR